MTTGPGPARPKPRPVSRMLQFLRSPRRWSSVVVSVMNPHNGEHANDNDDLAETEFPLGDGTAETEATVYCPYCNETIEIAIDPGGGPAQEYVEDCEVCCQPWSVSVRYGQNGSATVSIEPLDE